MKILDKYLLQRFTQNLLISLIAWILIFLVVDMIENVSRFIDRGATAGQFLKYYALYVPYIISLTLPIAILLSSLFTLGGLAQKNEVVAQLSAGVSLYRLLAPLFVFGLLISILSGFFNEFVVPPANQERLDLYRYDINNKTRPSETSRANIYIQDSPTRKVIVQYFNGKQNQGRQVSIQRIEGSTLAERIDAPVMRWVDTTWVLTDVTIRHFRDGQEFIHTIDDTVLTDLRIKPENLLELQISPEEMSYPDLNRYIDELKILGADTKRWLVDRHLKISLPFSNFIVILLGAPFASRKRRGGMGLNFGLGLIVTFVYFIIIRTGQVFGHQGQLEPWLAAWIGNLIFFVLGLLVLLNVKK